MTDSEDMSLFIFKIRMGVESRSWPRPAGRPDRRWPTRAPGHWEAARPAAATTAGGRLGAALWRTSARPRVTWPLQDDGHKPGRTEVWNWLAIKEYLADSCENFKSTNLITKDLKPVRKLARILTAKGHLT